MRIVLFLSMLGLLSACNTATQSVEEAVMQSKHNWQKWQKKYWSLYHYEPFDPPEQLAQVRYCYEADSDIVCYTRPQPQLTGKLVGYQGPPPHEMLNVIQNAEVQIVEDGFMEGEITVVELEDPTEPELMTEDMGEPTAQGSPQGLLSSF